MKFRAVLLLSSLLIPLVLLRPNIASATDPLLRLSIDPTIPQKAPLVYCTFLGQLDCVEKVLVEHPNKVIEEAKFIETRLVDFPNENGQKVQYGDILFDFHKESVSGPIERLRLSTNVITPTSTFNGKKAGAYWIVLQREITNGGKTGIEQTGICTTLQPLDCLNYPALDTPDIFHVYLRTSWLSPVSASGEGTHFNLDYRRIKSGIEWHFSGAEFLQPMFSDVTKLTESVKPGNENMIPDKLNPTLYFVLDHGGKDLSDSYWDPSCMEYGFTRTMWNAPMAGQLVWDYSTQSLNFNMYAPHLDPLGNPYLGSFHTRFQKAWLDCRFPGNTLSTATKLTVEVLSQDGKSQVATTSSSISNGIIDISATGFHFSSPRIVARKASDSVGITMVMNHFTDDWVSPEPSITLNADQILQKEKPPPVVKLKPKAKTPTIICIKGKLTRTVTSKTPKCPIGYKPKK